MLPSQPHPAVRATDALQKDLRSNKHIESSDRQSNCNNSIKKQSSALQKVSQTLGWRNRYSQSDYYPIEIQLGRFFKNDNVIAKATESKEDISAEEKNNELTTTILRIKQVQRGEIENTYGTGATVWPASVVLVKYLEHLQQQSNQDSIWNKRTCNQNRRRMTIADLGAGTGVTSIAAALYLGMDDRHEENAKDLESLIVCTDGVDSVVGLARENIENAVNELKPNNIIKTQIIDSVHDKLYQIGQSHMKIRKYLWGDGTMSKEIKSWKEMLKNYRNIDEYDDDEEENNNAFYDVILVSDCVLPKLYPIAPLVDAIDELAGPQTVAYISYEYRYYPEYDPKEYFVNLATQKGLIVKTVPLTMQHPIFAVDDIEIWEVRRKNVGV
mmetsp:Transcript_20596/g.25349  ORF Transcript_20596/g.25349 Transcript_20596/m.25349 type:complete len:384 (+) Transcript_20596:44-1195(+)